MFDGATSLQQGALQSRRNRQWGIAVEDRPTSLFHKPNKIILEVGRGRKGEEKKRQESFTDGFWVLMQNMSNTVHVWDMSVSTCPA